MSRKILVIESDEDSLSLVKQILEEKGYTVFGSIYLENAFEILGQGITIDVIFLSTYFENEEETSAIARLKEREQYSTIPIVGIVQSAETSEEADALEKGYTTVLVKPIGEEGLEKILKDLEI